MSDDSIIDIIMSGRHSLEQRECIKRGRGNDKNYGNIDDLNPKIYTAKHMNLISLGRGTNTNWKNVYHVDPRLNSPEQMQQLSFNHTKGKRK